jgi:DHA2 family multidrug resistance protein-like MFS transporter
MSYAPAEHAGMAASLEEIAIELGGAIGINVLGSVLAGVYATLLVLPNGAVLPPAVHEGVDQALVVAETLPPDMARLVTRSVHLAFDSAYFTALAINAALLAVVAIMAWRTRAAPPANRRVRPMRLPAHHAAMILGAPSAQCEQSR